MVNAYVSIRVCTSCINEAAEVGYILVKFMQD
jgi:hypothetical protein